MKIWIDFLTPKQAYFLGELSGKLEKEGHEVFKTTRSYREVNEALELRGIKAVEVGKHGGSSLRGKLVASAERTAGLAQIICDMNIDISVAFASPEAARTAFGLGIPHYSINDSPHSTAVALLTVPLSKKLFSPKIIPLEVWTNLGIERDRIVQYDALDPAAWLKGFLPDENILKNLKLDDRKPIVVFRVEESKAAYLLGKVPTDVTVIIQIIEFLLKEYNTEIQVVVLPRYKEQIQVLKEKFQSRIIIPEKLVDGPSLLYYSSLFVGAGGTMTAEAALLGTPTISCYPTKSTIVDKFLIKKGLVTRLTDKDEILEKVNQVLEKPDVWKKRLKEKTRNILSAMENPINIIEGTLRRDFS